VVVREQYRGRRSPGSAKTTCSSQLTHAAGSRVESRFQAQFDEQQVGVLAAMVARVERTTRHHLFERQK